MRRTALLGGLAALSLAFPALAEGSGHVYSVGPIEISRPWAREAIPNAPTSAGYMTLTNSGDEDDRLVGASAGVAEAVELHNHIMDGDVMRMRPVEAIEVPAGGGAELAPGGLHLMFFGLTDDFSEGSSFPLTLTFEHAGEVLVEVPVLDIGATGPAGMDHGGTSHTGHDG